MAYQLHQTVPYRYGPDATMVFALADRDCGPPADRYYDLAPTPVAQVGAGAPPRGVRARRADRE